MRRLLSIVLCVSIIASCTCRKRNVVRETRDFPVSEIPVLIEDQDERAAHFCLHYWDRFTETGTCWLSDEHHVNGVAVQSMKERVVKYVMLLRALPRDLAREAIVNAFFSFEKFQSVYGDSNLYKFMIDEFANVLYNPNSDYRNEDLYQPFVEKVSKSRMTPEDYRYGYEFDARMCSLNEIGTKAADIRFVENGGAERQMNEIPSEYLLLYFSNPDCSSCEEVTRQLISSRKVNALIEAGRLTVLNLYIDSEIEKWKKWSDEVCPKSWICGYDADNVIRMEMTYNVRAIPCLYLLDKEKNVLLKDASATYTISQLPNCEGRS